MWMPLYNKLFQMVRAIKSRAVYFHYLFIIHKGV